MFFKYLIYLFYYFFEKREEHQILLFFFPALGPFTIIIYHKIFFKPSAFKKALVHG
jgi:hypothetical protein